MNVVPRDSGVRPLLHVTDATSTTINIQAADFHIGDNNTTVLNNFAQGAMEGASSEDSDGKN